MYLFRNRPLCLCCTVAVLAAAAAGYFLPGWAKLALIGACTVIIPLCLFSKRGFFGFYGRYLGIVAFTLISSALLSSYIAFDANPSKTDTKSEHVIKGYATSVSYSAFGREARIEYIDGKAADIKAYVYIPDVAALEPYVLFSATAVFSPVTADENSVYLRGKGIYYTADCSEYETGGRVNSLGAVLCSFREACEGVLYGVCGSADIISCVFLGNRASAPPGLTADFKALGISHLLALSGLHITALLAGFDLVLRAVFGKRRWIFALLCAVALFYAALTGFSGSVLRAAVMYLFLSSGHIILRRVDSPTSLMLACAIIFIIRPYSVYDCGFLLSFSATAGIVLIGSPASSDVAAWLKAHTGAFASPLSYLCSSVIITLSALLFTIPAAALFFGVLVPGAVLYNIIFAPLVLVLLYLCPYLLFLSPVPLIGGALGEICDGVCAVMSQLASFFAGTTPFSLSLRYPFTLPLIIVFAVFLIMLSFMKFQEKRRYVAAFCAFAAVYLCASGAYSFINRERCELIVSAYGSGGTLAVVSGSDAAIIDCSGGETRQLYTLYKELLSRGITCADALYYTKVSSKHTSQYSVLARTLPVCDIYLPDCPGDEKYASKLLSRAVSGCDMYRINPPLAFNVGAVLVKIESFAASGGRACAVLAGNTVFISETSAGITDKFRGHKFDTAIYGEGIKSGTFLPVSASRTLIPDSMQEGFFTKEEKLAFNVVYYNRIVTLNLHNS